MFCPQCQAEYRQGFTVCADCEVPLVAALRADRPQTEGFDEGFAVIWKGDSESYCAALCLQLQDAGIRYEVAQDLRSRMGMTADWRYEIRVRKDDAHTAKERLGLPEVVIDESSSERTEPDEEEALPVFPEDGNAAANAARIRNSSNSYLDPWHPEDACVEIWKQSADYEYSTVELSLKANYIRVREEKQDDGSRKYFVMPEDEAIALEIIRQIVEGIPPT